MSRLGLVPRHQLAQEVPIEAMQVLDRVEHGESRTHAEKQRDLSEARLEIDDRGRPLRQPRHFDGAVHRDGRRARAALRAEEHVGDARLPRARRSPPRDASPFGAPRRGTTPPSSATAGEPAADPGEELVRARRASPAGSDLVRRWRRSRRCATVGCPARRRSIAAMPDEASARMSMTTTSGPAVSTPARRSSTMPTGTPHPRRSAATCRLNSSSCETMDAASCAMSGYWIRRIVFGNAAFGAGPFLS